MQENSHFSLRGSRGGGEPQCKRIHTLACADPEGVGEPQCKRIHTLACADPEGWEPQCKRIHTLACADPEGGSSLNAREFTL